MVDHEQATADLRFDNPTRGRQADIVSRQVISVRQGMWCRQRDQLVAEGLWKFRWAAPTRT